MPAGEWSDIHVGDRVQVVYEDSDVYGREGTITRVGSYDVRVSFGSTEEEVGCFSRRSSLKKLSRPYQKRPISPVFYSLKETT